MYYKKKPPPMPDWMRVTLLVFLMFLAYTGYQGERKAKEGVDAPHLAKYAAIEQFTDMGRWYRVLYPGFNRDLEYHDIVEGEGDGAACGQKVTLEVEDDAAPDEENRKKEPVEFVIGFGSVEAWDRGVRGMKLNGKRNIKVGARLVNRDEQALNAPDHVFTLKLTSLSPALPADAVPQSFTTVREGVGDATLNCADTGALKVRLWSNDGTLVYESGKEPIVIRVGSAQLGHGVDRGVVGMLMGEVRQLMIPPAYQPKAGDIPFPRNEIAIVEVMRIAYKEPENKPSTEEQPHEPDSEPTERDQTVPDDSGDDESGGAEGSR